MPTKLASNFAPDPTEEKIDRIVTLLTQIKEAVAPPWWKRLLNSLLSLAWKVLLLIIMTILSYYLWVAVSARLGGLMGGLSPQQKADQESTDITTVMDALKQLGEQQKAQASPPAKAK